MAYREQIEGWLAVAIAMIASFLDAYGIITYHTYVSFMSGNTTRTGWEIGQGNFGPATRSAVAIASFAGGSFAGALLAHSSVGRIRRLVLGVTAASLALIIALTQLGFLSEWASIAIISFAMGAMNTALSGVGVRSRVGAESVSLTFVTGTLSRIGTQLALAVKRAPLSDSQGPRDSHTRRALQLAVVWLGFLSGGVLSGAATLRFGVWALLFPMLALSALAVFDHASNEVAQPGEEFMEAIHRHSDP